MRSNNKQITTFFIICSLLLIGIIYAILQANLQINGIAKIKSNSWDIHFDNIQVNENSVAIGENDNSANIDPENNCKVDFEVTLSVPGDFYEFTVDVENAGTIDGMIGSLNTTLKVNNEVVSEMPNYLEYSVTYADGMEILENHKLEVGATETYRVRLEFKIDVEELPDVTTITTSLEPQYIQADTNSVARPNVFLYGTWNQIVDAYNSGNLTHLQTAMEEGLTRNVALDMNYDGTPETTAQVRIVNLSTPEECSSSDFSETACGFVIELIELNSTHRINPYTSSVRLGDGNKGGWEYSEMRAYLNSTLGYDGSFDYTNSGVFNSLPDELKRVIIPTRVVSGHGPYDSNNFVTTDKIYLFDFIELFGVSSSSCSVPLSVERQMDYFKYLGVTPSNASEIIMKISSNYYYWWTRCPYLRDYSSFLVINDRGGVEAKNTDISYRKYLAFRIAS
ncbi:MAG: hypothetical protein IJG68_02865 [Bacilli bacterium]|nr:hypothetical protein [Bacilli bacterium]